MHSALARPITPGRPISWAVWWGVSVSTVMAANGGCGIEIDVAQVSRREAGMTPYEVMLSESQERMLFVVERGREARVLEVFARWGLRCDVIGQVTDDGNVRVQEGAATV